MLIQQTPSADLPVSCGIFLQVVECRACGASNDENGEFLNDYVLIRARRSCCDFLLPLSTSSIENLCPRDVRQAGTCPV